MSKHLQRYRKKSKSKVYVCTKQDCFHRVDAEFLIGKHAECPSCGGEYSLTTEMLRRVIPHCISCTRGKKDGLVGDALVAIQEILRGKEDAKEAERMERFDAFTTGDVEGV